MLVESVALKHVKPDLVVADLEQFHLVRVEMLLPDLLQVVLILRKCLPVLESARLTHKNAVVHHKLSCLVLQTVDAELVKLVLNDLLGQISN